MFAVVLTGLPGAGKSSVLTALADGLSEHDLPHAAVEVEMLVWAHPALDDEQWLRHVAAICALYREAGHRLLLVAQTVETDADLAGCSTQWAPTTSSWCAWRRSRHAGRAHRRATRELVGLSELVEHAQWLAARMPALHGVELVLSTEDGRPEALALRIRAARPDQLRPLDRPPPAPP